VSRQPHLAALRRSRLGRMSRPLSFRDAGPEEASGPNPLVVPTDDNEMTGVVGVMGFTLIKIFLSFTSVMLMKRSMTCASSSVIALCAVTISAPMIASRLLRSEIGSIVRAWTYIRCSAARLSLETPPPAYIRGRLTTCHGGKP
jgi:hypothetical protein